MIVITILIILGLAGFCILAGEDLIHKSETTFLAWGIALFLLFACIGTLFVLQSEAKREAIIDYEAGKYYLETKIQSDTTYFVKRCKK